MRTFSVIAIILLLVSTVSIASAQEPGTAQDNACYTGGSMDGKCTTEWHWTCGWYVARYERGEFSLGQVRSDCAVSLIIPYLPPAKVEAAVQQLIQSGYFTPYMAGSPCGNPFACIDAYIFQWYAANPVPFNRCPASAPDISTHYTSIFDLMFDVMFLDMDPAWEMCVP